MKTAVIYRSRCGSTARYARWLGEALGCPVLDLASLPREGLREYDALIFGGGLCAGAVDGLKKFMGLPRREDCRTAVFAVGLSPENAPGLEEMWRRNLTPEQLADIPHFYLRGAFDYGKLSLVQRAMMGMMRRMLQKEKDPTPDQRGMLEAFHTPVDFTSREALAPILQWAGGGRLPSP